MITIKKRILAISDIHGCLQEFQELLALVGYDSNKDQLILLGDYMDRGKNSREVIYYVKDLVEKHGVIALKGNHDQLFCHWLHNPVEKQDHYFRNGGLATIQSFLGRIDNVEDIGEESYKKWAKEIMETHEEVIHFIEELPYYYETDDFIFVHAGIDPKHEDWKMTSEYEMVWIRDPFLKANHHHQQTFIHGHTPAIYLHDKADIYFGNRKIGIDGACVYGHQLNCLEIIDGKYQSYFIKNEAV